MGSTNKPSRYAEVLRFAIPVSLEVLLQTSLGLVDQLFVASLGEPSFVAAGLTGQLVTTVFVILAALGMGAAVQLARHAGARDSSLVVHLRDLGRFEGRRLASLLRLAVPIAAGQGVWVLGTMGYTRVYAALGTSGLAAANAVGALEGLWLTFSFGFGAACMTLVGHELGRKDADAAQALAADALRLSGGVALFTGSLLALCSPWADTFYPRLTESTLALTAVGMVAAGMMQPLKTLNMVLANGVLRTGGDLRFVLGCEFLMPIGILSAYVLGVWLGFGLLGALAGKACEEALKLGAHLWRYRSQRWIHELT